MGGWNTFMTPRRRLSLRLLAGRPAGLLRLRRRTRPGLQPNSTLQIQKLYTLYTTILIICTNVFPLK